MSKQGLSLDSNSGSGSGSGSGSDSGSDSGSGSGSGSGSDSGIKPSSGIDLDLTEFKTFGMSLLQLMVAILCAGLIVTFILRAFG